MKISKRKSQKKVYIITFVIVFMTICGLAAFYIINNQLSKASRNNTTKVNSIDFNPPTKEQSGQGTIIKSDSAQKGSSTDTNTSSSQLIITRPGLNEVVSDILQVRTLISSVNSSGTCKLSVSNADKIVTRTSGIQALASSSTCQGFDIPTSELYSGEWTINITVSLESSTLNSTTKVIIK